MIKFHKLLVPALAASLMGLISVQAQATTIAPLSTFYFSGHCSDCAGDVTARLVLQNYLQGTAINPAEFVSFTYGGSNLLSPYSILASETPNVSGNIPGALPGAADFHVSNSLHFFGLTTLGDWQTGNPNLGDFGTSGSFSPNAPSSVPEPATMLLMGAALAAAGLTRRRLRKS